MTNYESDSGQTASNLGGEGSAAAGLWERWSGAACAVVLWATMFLPLVLFLGHMVLVVLAGVLVGSVMFWIIWELAVKPLGPGGWVLTIGVTAAIALALLGGMTAGVFALGALERTLWAALAVFGIVFVVNSLRTTRRRSNAE